MLLISTGFVVSGVSFTLIFFMLRMMLSVFLRVYFGSSVAVSVAGEMGFYLDLDLALFLVDSLRF
jgi:hypothetical protein